MGKKTIGMDDLHDKIAILKQEMERLEKLKAQRLEARPTGRSLSPVLMRAMAHSGSRCRAGDHNGPQRTVSSGVCVSVPSRQVLWKAMTNSAVVSGLGLVSSGSSAVARQNER